MTDLEGGVVMLNHKQKLWRKNYQEGSVPNGLTLFICPFKFWTWERNCMLVGSKGPKRGRERV